jgi:hypothetical protein
LQFAPTVREPFLIDYKALASKNYGAKIVKNK